MPASPLPPSPLESPEQSPELRPGNPKYFFGITPDSGGLRRRWTDFSITDLDIEEEDEDFEEDEDEFESEEMVALERRPSWVNFPQSPMGIRFFPRQKSAGNEPRIGVDIGGVITRRTDHQSLAKEWGLDHATPGAFNAAKRLVAMFGDENVFLVSKVRPGGAMQRKTEHWLHETCHFCENTGVLEENIIFCSTIAGEDGKGIIAERLCLSHFIDDNVQVLAAVFGDPCGNSGHLIEKFSGILFHFSKGGDGTLPSQAGYEDVPPRMKRFCRPVADWASLLKELEACGIQGRNERMARLDFKNFAEKYAPEPSPPTDTFNTAPVAAGSSKECTVPSAANASQINSTCRPEVAPIAQPDPVHKEEPPWNKAPKSTQLAENLPAGRPRLQLKPRSEHLGQVGGLAEVSGKTQSIFGRND